MENLVNFWSNKKVVITGHTGFKGSWLSLFLKKLNAEVYGVSLPLNEEDITFKSMKISDDIIKSDFLDITNKIDLKGYLDNIKPDFIFHLAAQSLVGYSYENPVETFTTNFNGTLNILEWLRSEKKKISTIIVTSDKCYENDNSGHAFLEEDKLGGYDPYSSSKACAEILTSAYIRSYFNDINFYNHLKSVNSARAGNVIGGGDWSKNRLFPDIFRAVNNKKTIQIRNKSSVRPWQFVLDPLYGYIRLAQLSYQNEGNFNNSAWNFGPSNISNNLTVNDILELTKKHSKHEVKFKFDNDMQQFHEALNLNLNSKKSNDHLNWSPQLSVEEAVQWTTAWYDIFIATRKDILEFSLIQVEEYSKKLSKV